MTINKLSGLLGLTAPLFLLMFLTSKPVQNFCQRISVMKNHLISILVTAIVFSALATSAETVKYVYDDLNRLDLLVKEGEYAIDYDYDEIGNRTIKSVEELGIFVSASFTHSHTDSNFQVFFDASDSACYEKIFDPILEKIITVDVACDYTWDCGGAGNIVGGNATGSIIFYRYTAAGFYDVSLTVTLQQDPSVTDSIIKHQIEAKVVEPIFPSVDFDITVSGTTVTLKSQNIPNDVVVIASAEVFWGDRWRTKINKDPQSAFASGIDHTYDISGMTRFMIRVRLVDTDGNQYTYIDPDFEINFP